MNNKWVTHKYTNNIQQFDVIINTGVSKKQTNHIKIWWILRKSTGCSDLILVPNWLCVNIMKI